MARGPWAVAQPCAAPPHHHHPPTQALSDKNQRAGKVKGRAASKKANARGKKKRSGGEAYAERHKAKVGVKGIRKGKQANAKRMY